MQEGFFVRINNRFERILFRDVVCVEACKNYMKITTQQRSYLALVTMKNLEQLLPVNMFLRVHKSFIVSLEKITAFDAEQVYLGDRSVPVGNLYKGRLESMLIIAQNEPANPVFPFCSLQAANRVAHSIN